MDMNLVALLTTSKYDGKYEHGSNVVANYLTN